jgi:hypothetical protein
MIVFLVGLLHREAPAPDRRRGSHTPKSLRSSLLLYLITVGVSTPSHATSTLITSLSAETTLIDHYGILDTCAASKHQPQRYQTAITPSSQKWTDATDIAGVLAYHPFSLFTDCKRDLRADPWSPRMALAERFLSQKHIPRYKVQFQVNTHVSGGREAAKKNLTTVAPAATL